MKKEYADLIYALPEGLDDDGSDLIGLEREYIPWERVPKLVELLSGDEWVAFESARLLCYWGNDVGGIYMVCSYRRHSLVETVRLSETRTS